MANKKNIIHAIKDYINNHRKTVIIAVIAMVMLIRGIMLANGFCFAQFRTLSDQELFDKALHNFVYSQYDCKHNKNLPLCTRIYEGNRYLDQELDNWAIMLLLEETLISHESKYIPYQSIDEVKQINPDCCQFFDTFAAAYEASTDGIIWHYSEDIIAVESAASIWNQYITNGLRIMVLTVKLRYQDSNKNEIVKIWVPFSNCGEYYGPNLESYGWKI